jgi:succinate dehydrogenase hydrophobic anchor subunit
MVYIFQIVAELSVLGVSFIFLDYLMKKFKLRLSLKSLLFFPLIIFVIGFSLRLSESKLVIDTGYFMTEFTYVFIYLIFAMAVLLGQLKYWKIE